MNANLMFAGQVDRKTHDSPAARAGPVHIFPDSDDPPGSLSFHASKGAGMSVHGVTAHDSPRRAFAV